MDLSDRCRWGKRTLKGLTGELGCRLNVSDSFVVDTVDLSSSFTSPNTSLLTKIRKLSKISSSSRWNLFDVSSLHPSTRLYCSST